jgi:hypothetical protein
MQDTEAGRPPPDPSQTTSTGTRACLSSLIRQACALHGSLLGAIKGGVWGFKRGEEQFAGFRLQNRYWHSSKSSLETWDSFPLSQLVPLTTSTSMQDNISLIPFLLEGGSSIVQIRIKFVPSCIIHLDQGTQH